MKRDGGEETRSEGMMTEAWIHGMADWMACIHLCGRLYIQLEHALFIMGFAHQRRLGGLRTILDECDDT